MSALMQYLGQILAWLLSFVDWIFLEIFQLICNAAIAIIAALPLPSWVSGAGTMVGGLPSGVLYLAQAFDLGTGLQIMFSAWGLRFLIRRIPFIG
jgi:predicted lipid-binding transport protein (Tim44 family)